MNLLINEYRETVSKTVDRICKLQSAVAVIVGTGIILFSDYISHTFAQVAALLTLLSIPSMAWIAKLIISRHETRGWRRRHPEIDFSGDWLIKTTFLNGFKVVEGGDLPPDQEGRVTFRQTPFGISLASTMLASTSSQTPLSGWLWLAASLSEDGNSIFSAYRMRDCPDPNLLALRSHGQGFECIDVSDRLQSPKLPRPCKLTSYWYDCMRNDPNATFFIGKTCYERV